MKGVTVSSHPKTTKWPKKNMTYDEKIKWISNGIVTVGRFNRFIEKERRFESFYLPRIRGRNFKNNRKIKHPGYKTADQAYTIGKIIHRKIKEEEEAL